MTGHPVVRTKRLAGHLYKESVWIEETRPSVEKVIETGEAPGQPWGMWLDEAYLEEIMLIVDRWREVRESTCDDVQKSLADS